MNTCNRNYTKQIYVDMIVMNIVLLFMALQKQSMSIVWHLSIHQKVHKDETKLSKKYPILPPGSLDPRTDDENPKLLQRLLHRLHVALHCL